jgi:hypothetical protein
VYIGKKERRAVQTDGQTFQSKKHDSGLKRANNESDDSARAELLGLEP